MTGSRTAGHLDPRTATTQPALRRGDHVRRRWRWALPGYSKRCAEL